MKTDLKPIPFAPMYPYLADFVLCPTEQIASKSSAVNPSSLHSTIIRELYTLKRIKAAALFLDASVNKLSSAFWRSSKTNRALLPYISLANLKLLVSNWP